MLAIPARFICVLALVTTLVTTAAAALDPVTDLKPGIVTPAAARTDRIIIKPKANAAPQALDKLHQRFGTRWRHRAASPDGVDVIDLPPGLAVAAAVAHFKGSGAVEYAEPDYLLKVLATPNDFRYNNLDQWNLKNTGIYGGRAGADINAEAGWDLQTDASNVIVAVVDTGVRYTHEDLAGNMWVNPGESGTDGSGRDKRTNLVDDDGNGYVDDVHGINVLTRTGNPMDDWGHGTHVAGIVGAGGNNTVGIAGVAWRVKIMAIKFIDAQANYSVSDAVIALEYARRHGAKIVTASWGNYSFTSQALRDAFVALRTAGIIVTAAAGNDNNNNDVTPLYPASYDYDNVVAVAATNRIDDRAGYSNYGSLTVDIGAPGSPVFSAWAGSDTQYLYAEGTSMAAPHVAGACALLWARFPGSTHQQIIQQVLGSAEPIPSMSGRVKTNGRLDLAAALASGTPPPPPPPPPPPTNLTATLAWADNSTTETAFEIERSLDNVAFTLIASVSPNTTSTTDPTLERGKTYFYRVRARQDTQASTYSNIASLTTPP